MEKISSKEGSCDEHSVLLTEADGYGDTVEQSWCTFSRLIRANDITTASPYIERDAICPNDWARKHARS